MELPFGLRKGLFTRYFFLNFYAKSYNLRRNEQSYSYQILFLGIILSLTQYTASVSATEENNQGGGTQVSLLVGNGTHFASSGATETLENTIGNNSDITLNTSMPETDMTSAVTDLSTTVVTVENDDEPDKCVPDNCTSTNSCTFVKSEGCIRLREGVTDNSFAYTISVPNESSSIYVEMGKDNEDLSPDSSITIEFKECDETRGIWMLEEQKPIQKQHYVSIRSNLTLHISTNGNWMNATIYYWELEFREVEDKVDDSLDAGVLVPPSFREILCRPNTNKTFLLTASKSRWNESSVMMTLSFVDLDELAGDYLLIGAGKSPFAGPHPFFFTGKVAKSRDYYIASDDVYVVLVSKASQETDKKGFSIKWERSGTAISKPDEEPDEETIADAIIQSVGICFYNKSFIAEFNRTEGYIGPLQSFREKLASVANGYAKERKMLENSVLTASSVEIFRVSSIIERMEGVMPEGGIYAMLTIVQRYDRKIAVFRRKQLEEIISKLEKEDEEAGYPMLGFKVGHCPSTESYFQWYLAATLLVLVSTIVLTVVWVCSSLSRWRGFPSGKKRSNDPGNVFSKEPNRIARENVYVTTAFVRPQTKVTGCDGETITLESYSMDQPLSEGDEESERVIFDQGWLQRRASRDEQSASLVANAEIEPRQPFLQTFAAPLPKTRDNRFWTTDIQMFGLFPQDNPQPVEHEYDCLVLPEHESETKL